MKIAVIILVLSCPLLAAWASPGEQTLSPARLNAVLYCTLNNDGPWIDRDLQSDGYLRLSYTLDPIRPRQISQDLYVAFWTSSRETGKLIHFQLSRVGPRRKIAIVNDAWIVRSNGRLDLSDAWGGTYTYDELMKRLKKLAIDPIVEVPIKQVTKPTDICSSPLSK